MPDWVHVTQDDWFENYGIYNFLIFSPRFIFIKRIRRKKQAENF